MADLLDMVVSVCLALLLEVLSAQAETFLLGRQLPVSFDDVSIRLPGEAAAFEKARFDAEEVRHALSEYCVASAPDWDAVHRRASRSTSGRADLGGQSLNWTLFDNGAASVEWPGGETTYLLECERIQPVLNAPRYVTLRSRDPQQAAAFYRKALGWSVTVEEPARLYVGDGVQFVALEKAGPDQAPGIAGIGFPDERVETLLHARGIPTSGKGGRTSLTDPNGLRLEIGDGPMAAGQQVRVPSGLGDLDRLRIPTAAFDNAFHFYFDLLRLDPEDGFVQLVAHQPPAIVFWVWDCDRAESALRVSGFTPLRTARGLVRLQDPDLNVVEFSCTEAPALSMPKRVEFAH